MKIAVVLLLLTLNLSRSYAQDKNDWVMFRDKKTDLIGYKNSKGKIKIDPKFTSPTSASIFKDIIPVFEKVNKSNKDDYKTSEYYLLKNGTKVGIDSVYMWDFNLDCENENKIRFRDPKTDKVGFFDKNGKILIPAIYNEATPFYNDLAIAIKNGKRICWEGNEYSAKNPCEHWSWEGNYMLINKKNETLLENLDLHKMAYINFYSIKVNKKNLDSIFVTFRSNNGNTYSFIDFDKEFKRWFYNDFIKSKNSIALLDNMFKEITISKKHNWKSKELNNKLYKDVAWINDSKENIYSSNRLQILKVLNKLNDKKLEVSISPGTGPIQLNYKLNKKYFSNCGEYFKDKYPYFEIHITKKDGFILNSLGFIKTENRYKLLEIY